MTAPRTRRIVPLARPTSHRRRPTVAELERRVLLDAGAGGGGIHPNSSTAYISIAITSSKTTVTAGDEIDYTVTAYKADGTVDAGNNDLIDISSTSVHYGVVYEQLKDGTNQFFNELTTAGQQTFTATDRSNKTLTSTSPTITVNPAAFDHYTISHTSTAGGDRAGATLIFVVGGSDRWGNQVPGPAATFAASDSDSGAVITPAGGNLGDNPTIITVTTDRVGTQTLTVTPSGSYAAAKSQYTVQPGLARHLVVGLPATTTAGVVVSATVTSEDLYGNVATDDSSSFAITSSDPTAVTGGTLVDGTATVPVAFTHAGAATLAATTRDGTETGTSPAISVAAAAATHLVVAPVAASLTAGQAVPIAVTAEDAYGNVATTVSGPVALTSTDGQAVIAGGGTLTAGTGTFAVVLRTAGSQTITASTASPALAATTAAIAVAAATPTHLVLTTKADASTVAGAALSVTATAEDAYGNVATAAGGPLALASTDGQAILPANVTLSAGAATFAATFRTAGVQTVTATGGTPTVTGTTAGVAVVAATATHLVVTSSTANATADQAVPIAVTAEDAYGNVVAADAATFTLISSDPGVGPIGGTLAGGTATVPVVFTSVGQQTVTATTQDGTATGTSGGIGVVAGAATQFVVAITGRNSDAAGASFRVTVTAEDRYANVATTVNGPLALTSTDKQAVLPGGVTLAAGTASFDVALETAGTQTLTVAGSNPAVTATTGGIVVVAAAPTHLVVTSYTANATAGQAVPITVSAEDAYGNLATGFNGPVTLTSTDPGFGTTGGGMLTAGTETVAVTLETAGTQTITAATDAPALTGTSARIAVVAAPPEYFSTSIISATGFPVTAGTTFQMMVTARDNYSNVATTFAGPITLTSSDGQAILPSGVTLVAGVATFPVTLKTAGAQSITATAVDSQLMGTTGPFSVVAASPTHLALTTTAAASDPAGASFKVTAAAEDAYGNVVKTAGGPLTLTSTDAAAILPSGVSLADGTATFAVTLRTAGSRAITVASGLAGVPAATIDQVVVPAGATRLVVVGPAAAAAGEAASYTVTAYDAAGNVATGATGPVVVSSSDAGALLPVGVALRAGVATFAVTFATAGAHTVTVADPAIAGLTGATATPATATVRGTVYLDLNDDGVRGAGEPGLAGRAVYLDLNGDGRPDDGEPTATTDAAGGYSFPNVAVATTAVREDTSLDPDRRLVVDRTHVNADGSVDVGVVVLSGVAPLPVVSGLLPATASTDADVAYVAALYRGVLGRDGTTAEVADWVAAERAGLGRAAVAAAFINSPEHRQAEVAAYYREFLGRTPDPTAAAWVDDLLAGASEAAVVAGILASPEYQQGHPDASSFVAGLYSDVLGRRADAAGSASWATALGSGADRAAVALDFATSPEANDAAVQGFYRGFLHRQSESGESTVWTDLLAAGSATIDDVAAGILASDEFLREAQAGAA